GPARVEEPQRAAAQAAEVALAAAEAAVGQPGAVDRQVLLSSDLEAAPVGAEIDRVAPTAGRLATDRAVAAHVRVRRRRAHGEAHRAAMAGALEFHAASGGRLGRRR